MLETLDCPPASTIKLKRPKGKRFTFSLVGRQQKEFVPAASAYRLPPPPPPPPPQEAPQPGIRVSSLGEGPTPASRPRSGSLQRSLSSPASLRSRSLREEENESGVSPDCVVGSSRSHFAVNTPALSIVADYYAAATIDEEADGLPQVEKADSTTSSYHSCSEFEWDLSKVDKRDDLLLETFARFTRSDTRLTAAVEALADRQDAMHAQVGGRRATARRTSSLPLLPHVDISTPPIPPRASTPARSRWQAISSIMRPQPELPSQDEPESPSSEESEEDEPDPRLLIRLAVDDVRAAQSNLLACLSELALLTGLSQQQGYEQQTLVSAQNIIADTTFDVGLEEMQNLRALAMRTCETLERVRELSATLVPPMARSLSHRRIRISAVSGGLPIAPQRASSLPNVNKAFAHKQTLLSALSAWDIAYREFVRGWRHHQHSVRLARRQARAQLRMTVAQRHGLQKELAAAEGLGTVIATAKLVAATLERAICDNLITRQEAINLEPRVFFALPRLSILYGAREALLPASWETPSPRLGEDEDSSRPERPLTLFLPRICGSLSNEMIRTIRGLSPHRLSVLARMLSGESSSHSPRMSSISASDLEIWELYRNIAALADRESIGGRKWGRVLSKCLKAWAAEQISLHENSVYHHRL